MKNLKKLTAVLIAVAVATALLPCDSSAYAGSPAAKSPTRPVIKQASVKGSTVSVRWSKSKRASKYTVYVRKGADGWKYWKSVKKTKKNKKKYADRLKYRLRKSGKKYKVYKRKHPYKAAKKLKGTKWSFKGSYGKTYGIVILATNGQKRSKYSHPKEVTIPARGSSPQQGAGDRKIETRPISAKDLASGITFPTPPDAAPNAEFKSAAASFSVELFKKTAADSAAAGNILISPDSVMTALSMVQNGARGQTLSEMESLYAGSGGGLTTEELDLCLSTLNRRLSSSKDMIYQVANSIWAKQDDISVSKDFLQTNKMYHDASFYIAPFDQTTVTDMNNWVFNNTRNLIEKIVEQLEADDMMVLIDTIAFEGEWEEPFYDEQVDKKGKFTQSSGAKQTVSMLNGSLDRGLSPYVTAAGGEGFVKYYNGRQIAFMALLPPSGKSVDEYIQSLSGSALLNAWGQRSNKYEVRIRIPEFKYDYGVSMAGILRSMGMHLAFTADADFSGILAEDSVVKSLMIGDVLHKTYIELDRNGTKAAAATAIVMKDSSIMPGQTQVKQIYLDRPFVYALVDCETGLPLFIGAVKKIY